MDTILSPEPIATLAAFAKERLAYPEATWGERELARRILSDDGSLGEARELLRIALPIIHAGDPLLALRIEHALKATQTSQHNTK